MSYMKHFLVWRFLPYVNIYNMWTIYTNNFHIELIQYLNIFLLQTILLYEQISFMNIYIMWPIFIYEHFLVMNIIRIHTSFIYEQFPYVNKFPMWTFFLVMNIIRIWTIFHIELIQYTNKNYIWTINFMTTFLISTISFLNILDVQTIFI
jgi:hypothetical protein